MLSGGSNNYILVVADCLSNYYARSQSQASLHHSGCRQTVRDKGP